MTDPRPRSLARLVMLHACAAMVGLAAAVALPSAASAAPAPAAAKLSVVSSSASNCLPTVLIAGQWSGAFTATVTLTNVGTTTWQTWYATVQPPPGYRIVRWGIVLDPNTFSGPGPVPPGASVAFSFIAMGAGPVGPISVVCTGV